MNERRMKSSLLRAFVCPSCGSHQQVIETRGPVTCGACGREVRLTKLRKPIKKRRSGGPRRGRVVDKAYMVWLATQPPLIPGKLFLTFHHVRRNGEQKNDRRTVLLHAEHHLHDFGKYSIERIGKEKFEAMFRVDLEAAIVKQNARYEREKDQAA